MVGCGKKELGLQPSFYIQERIENGNEEIAYLDQYLDSFLYNNGKLTDKTGNGYPVEWTVSEGNAIIEDNKIIKLDTAQEYESVILHAKITKGEEIMEADFNQLLLLDEKVAYLMSYFGGEGKKYERPKLAYTFDGLLWYELNEDKAIFSAKTGSKKIRDPYITRKKDGSFSMIATQGWDNPSIYVWDSKDCVTFENERLLQVNKTSDELAMSEKQAWAPEAFYDRRIDKMVLYWSSPSDNGMYYNMTEDFIEFSYPRKLLDPGFTVIDGTIYKKGFDYGIIVKDEREPMEEYSQLFLASSDTDYLGFNTFSKNMITGHQSEGPFFIESDYYTLLYYDDYTRFQFQAKKTYDVFYDEYEDFSVEKETIMPMEKPRHASVIPITWKELERIKAGYEK